MSIGLPMIAVALLASVFVPQSPPATGATLGELRKLVPPALRPRYSDLTAWKYVQLAAPYRKGPTAEEIADLANSPGARVKMLGKYAAPPSAPRKENVRDLLRAWNDPKEKNLPARTEVVLRDYRARFAAMDKALAFPHWAKPRKPDSYVPRPFDMADDSLQFPLNASLKELTYAEVLQARLDLARKKPINAERRLAKARSIGEHLCGMEDGIIGYLVGLAACAIADRNVHLIAQQRLLPMDAVVRLTKHMVDFPVREEYAAAIRGEFNGPELYAFANMPDPRVIPKAKRKDWGQTIDVLEGHPNPLDRAQTMSWLADLAATETANLNRSFVHPVSTDAKIKAIVAPLPAGYLDLWDNKPLDAEKLKATRKALLPISNPLGRTVVQLSGSLSLGTASAFRAESRRRLEALATAVQTHKRRTGSWPAHLEELSAADGIVHPLRDVLTGASFRYDKASLEVWSIALEDGKPIKNLRVPIVLPLTPAK